VRPRASRGAFFFPLRSGDEGDRSAEVSRTAEPRPGRHLSSGGELTMTETRNPSGDVDLSYTEVTKVFRVGLRRTKTAVSGVSFSVPRGSVVGLLGPNGSGKSTLLKMTLGFMRPTSGEILVCGH